MNWKSSVRRQEGFALIFTCIAIVAVIACIALALELTYLSISAVQQRNNAQYGGEAALSAFVPAVCAPGESEDVCAKTRCDTKGFTVTECALPASLARGIAAADAVTGQNSYLGAPHVAQSLSGGGSIAFGRCLLRNPATMGWCTKGYCCFTIDAASVVPVGAASVPSTKPELWVNAVKIHLTTGEGVTERASRTFFRVFGVSGVPLRKGDAIAHFDRARVQESRGGMHPYQFIDAQWDIGPATGGVPYQYFASSLADQ